MWCVDFAVSCGGVCGPGVLGDDRGSMARIRSKVCEIWTHTSLDEKDFSTFPTKVVRLELIARISKILTSSLRTLHFDCKSQDNLFSYLLGNLLQYSKILLSRQPRWLPYSCAEWEDLSMSLLDRVCLEIFRSHRLPRTFLRVQRPESAKSTLYLPRLLLTFGPLNPWYEHELHRVLSPRCTDVCLKNTLFKNEICDIDARSLRYLLRTGIW